MDRRPPLSPLEALQRFAAATEEMAAARGQLASSAGRFGPPTPAETSRYLLAVFAQGTSGDVLPYWKMAALIRPLARFAAPGAESGLALDLPAAASRAGVRPRQGGALRGRRLPGPLTHEPTRRFLSGTGLPEDGLSPSSWTPKYRCRPSRSTARTRTATAELPEGAGDLIRLGHLRRATAWSWRAERARSSPGTSPRRPCAA